MRIYASQAFGEHQTGVHPERPERTMVVNQRLAEAGRIAEAAMASWSMRVPGRSSPDMIPSRMYSDTSSERFRRRGTRRESLMSDRSRSS